MKSMDKIISPLSHWNLERKLYYHWDVMWIMKINTNTEVVRQFFCKLIIIKKLFLPIGLYERGTYYRGMVMGLPLSCCFSLHVNRHLNIVLLSACLFKALLHKSPVCSDWSAHTSLNRHRMLFFPHLLCWPFCNHARAGVLAEETVHFWHHNLKDVLMACFCAGDTVYEYGPWFLH